MSLVGSRFLFLQFLTSSLCDVISLSAGFVSASGTTFQWLTFVPVFFWGLSNHPYRVISEFFFSFEVLRWPCMIGISLWFCFAWTLQQLPHYNSCESFSWYKNSFPLLCFLFLIWKQEMAYIRTRLRFHFRTTLWIRNAKVSGGSEIKGIYVFHNHKIAQLTNYTYAKEAVLVFSSESY